MDEKSQIPTLTNVRNGTMPANNYGPDSLKAAVAVLKKEYQSQDFKKKTQNSMQAYPLNLTLTLVGIEGIRFGDYIQTDFLPARYQPESLGGLKVVFTVLNVTQTFKKRGGAIYWQTNLKTICRLAPD
jgi:hypothetical protein